MLRTGQETPYLPCDCALMITLTTSLPHTPYVLSLPPPPSSLPCFFSSSPPLPLSHFTILVLHYYIIHSLHDHHYLTLYFLIIIIFISSLHQSILYHSIGSLRSSSCFSPLTFTSHSAAMIMILALFQHTHTHKNQSPVKSPHTDQQYT